MAVIGVDLPQDELVLTKGRDFKWAFVNLNDAGVATAFPAGTLFFEFDTTPTKTTYNFTISGSTATINLASTTWQAVLQNRTKWQLVFKQTGVTSGGDPLARGLVRIQE